MVVVDKMAHFIPTTTKIDAKGTARLLIDNVWKLHGTPLDTISDRGPQFASKVTRSFFQQLGITPRFSTVYHPQTDGQTERVNPILEQYLRLFIAHHQNDWSEFLSLAEFSYNNSIHSSIGVSPFYANYGYHPTFTTNPSKGQTSPEAGELINRIEQVQEELKSAMLIAQERQKRAYNRHRDATPEFEVGDEVWLESTNICTDRPSAKLAPRRLGPYRILERVSSHAYHLALPPTMRIHNVFHVDLLSAVYLNDIPGREFERPDLEIVEGEEHLERSFRPRINSDV